MAKGMPNPSARRHAIGGRDPVPSPRRHGRPAAPNEEELREIEAFKSELRHARKVHDTHANPLLFLWCPFCSGAIT